MYWLWVTTAALEQFGPGSGQQWVSLQRRKDCSQYHISAAGLNTSHGLLFLCVQMFPRPCMVVLEFDVLEKLDCYFLFIDGISFWILDPRSNVSQRSAPVGLLWALPGSFMWGIYVGSRTVSLWNNQTLPQVNKHLKPFLICKIYTISPNTNRKQNPYTKHPHTFSKS